MKRILFLISCLALIASGTLAQSKVIERSAKNKPTWLYEQPNDFLVVTADAPTLAQAQKEVMDLVRENIIQAIALNISSRQEMNIQNANSGGIISTDELFTSRTKMAAAQLPYIKDISSTKIDEIYWEKSQDKKTKRESYSYSVKYPFSAAERATLLSQFERIDKENEGLLNLLETNVTSVESATQISEAIAKLDELNAYFFDDVRLQKVEGLKTRYNGLYNEINLASEEVDNGTYKLYFLLSGRPFQVGAVPKVTSECASQIDVQPTEGGFLISCSTIDCLAEEDNTLKVNVRINGRQIKHTIHLNL